MLPKVLMAAAFLTGIACFAIALFYLASAIFSARSNYAAKKRANVLDLVPFLLLTPFVYNRIGRSYLARAVCYAILCGVFILLANLIAESAGIITASQ